MADEKIHLGGFKQATGCEDTELRGKDWPEDAKYGSVQHMEGI